MKTTETNERSKIKYSCVVCNEEILDEGDPLERYELRGNYCPKCSGQINRRTAPWAYNRYGQKIQYTKKRGKLE